jgi:hypothetical protein
MKIHIVWRDVARRTMRYKATQKRLHAIIVAVEKQ